MAPIMSGRKERLTLWQQFRRLFFIYRRPKLHIPLEWTQPDEETYHQQMITEGLIAWKKWKYDEIAENGTIMQDIKDLEQHLVPVFWEYNQKSLYYQNRYYLYQWIFLSGALLTTILGALSTYAYVENAAVHLNPQSMGIATALLSAGSAFVNGMSVYGQPLKRWTKYRRLVEELRRTYYLFLSRQKPYDDKQRLLRLRQTLIQIRRKERENA